ncbi:MAG: DUF4349 domain-containing protein [Chloroflexi bacterium]|nr:DUF4349 domain-containing protein [Chloroflexota bacterium]
MTLKKGILLGLPLSLLLLALLATACGGGGRESVGSPGAPGPTRPPASTPTPAPFAFGKDAALSFSDSRSAAQPQARMVVRTVNMMAIIQDVPRAVEDISAMVGQMGGFVVSTSLRGQEEQDTIASISFRVPSEKAEEALARVRGMASRVPAEQNSGQDVTEEYVDLKARLDNLEASEKQLRGVMDRAQTVEDILKVQAQLTQVRGDIESFKARTLYLERTSATVLINVELLPLASTKPLVSPGWSARETAKSAVRTLSGGGQNLADFAIRAAVLSPLWLPEVLVLAALLAWLVRRLAAARAHKA